MGSLARVTQSTISAGTIASLQDAIGRVQDLQDKLSSGKQINRPSDDPGGTAQALNYRAQIKRTTQYGTNSHNGLDWLGTADTTMTNMHSQIQRARSLTLQAANASMSSDERTAIAQEIDTIRQAMIGMANTTYMDRPIFAGNMSNPTGNTVAYDDNGNYQGDSGQVMRNVGPGVQDRKS